MNSCVTRGGGTRAGGRTRTSALLACCSARCPRAGLTSPTVTLARARAKPRSCRCAAGTRGRCLCDARAALPLFFVSPRSPVRGGRARPRNLVFRPQLPRADVPHAPTNQRRATAACRPACRGDAQQQRLNARLRLPRARSQGDGGRLVQHGSQGQGGARVGAARRAPKNLLTAGAAAGARGLPLASRAPARR